MNILHMKYAVEVARLGSLNKAAEVLYVAQPNISRSIKELEADLGIVIFRRSAKGMMLTPDGQEFISCAQHILRQIDEVEMLYKHGLQRKERFSISVPRSGYISEAFAQFSKSIKGNAAEIFYEETNTQITIDKVLNNDYKLGIIRYAEEYDKYYKPLLEDKGILYELVSEFSYVLTISRKHPLVGKADLSSDDLSSYIEVLYADQYIPAVPLAKSSKGEFSDGTDRRIFVFERAGQLELLCKNHEAFMWSSPEPQEILERYDLVQLKCAGTNKRYKDVLIYREDYRLSELDNKFITALCESKRRVFK